MTRESPSRAAYSARRPDTLSSDEDRVYGLLAAVCGPSGRCDANLDQIGRLLRIRPVSLRIALLSLRVRRRVRVRRMRGETVSVVLDGKGTIRS